MLEGHQVLDLDSEILNRVDPFSISSVKDAGLIVDAWKDPTKQAAMTKVLMVEVANKNERVIVGQIFKRCSRPCGRPPRGKQSGSTLGMAFVLSSMPTRK